MECPVCLDPFSDPVVLPCGHTLCRTTCAQGLVREDCLKCPTCRTVHWVPDGVEGLPRNYALQQFMERPDEVASGEEPACEAHPDVSVSMLCIPCYQPVCLRCCLGSPDGTPPKHFQHEVIPTDSLPQYLQSLSSCVSEYLQTRRDEELTKFMSLSDATVQQQDMLKKGRSSILREKKRLMRLLDDRSQALFGQLQAWVARSDLPDQSGQVLERVLEFNSLEDQCQNLSRTDERNVWQKCEDIKRLLERVDRLPSATEPPISRHLLSSGKFVLNTDHLKHAIQRTLTLDTEVPAPPQFSSEDCVFGDTSAAIAWLFSEGDHVNYFTVYYETAIFVRGMCNDCQSFDVTDFGQTRAQTTIRDLRRDHRYRVHVVARNNAGASQRSQLLYFKTNSSDSDMKII